MIPHSLKSSVDGVTSSLTTKAYLCFVSFDSFGIGGIDLMVTLLPFVHIDVLFIVVGSINIMML